MRAYTAISCLAHALEITTIGLDSGIKRERINNPWRRCNTVDAPFKPGLLTTKEEETSEALLLQRCIKEYCRQAEMLLSRQLPAAHFLNTVRDLLINSLILPKVN